LNNRPEYSGQADSQSAPSAAGYFDSATKPVYGFLFVLPILLVYEFLIIFTGTPIRNGADVILKLFFNLVGIKTIIGFTLVVMTTYAYIVFSSREAGEETIYPVYFLLMFAESVVYAMSLGPLILRLMRGVKEAVPGLYASGHAIASGGGDAVSTGVYSMSERLIAALGAGIYEEFVFRYMLVTFFVYLFVKLFALSKWQAAAFAIFWASLIFSGFHYVGELGDRFEVASFIYRFIAGVILSLLYFFRGYGIAVYTHALYDLKLFFL